MGLPLTQSDKSYAEGLSLPTWASPQSIIRTFGLPDDESQSTLSAFRSMWINPSLFMGTIAFSRSSMSALLTSTNLAPSTSPLLTIDSKYFFIDGPPLGMFRTRKPDRWLLIEEARYGMFLQTESKFLRSPSFNLPGAQRKAPLRRKYFSALGILAKTGAILSISTFSARASLVPISLDTMFAFCLAANDLSAHAIGGENTHPKPPAAIGAPAILRLLGVGMLLFFLVRRELGIYTEARYYCLLM